jgi:hypothetical protein
MQGFQRLRNIYAKMPLLIVTLLEADKPVRYTERLQEAVMAHRLHQVTRQLLAITFINHVVAAADCGRRPAEVERWGEAFEAEILGIIRDEPNGKWKRYLRGVLPAQPLRAALVRTFPILAEVLGNPLWRVLRLLEDGSARHETLVEQLRLDGKPLQRRNLKRLQRCVSNADWRDLVFLLVILASRSPSYQYAREFVQERFDVFVLLLCVQPEFADTEERLYQVLDHHFRAGHLAHVKGWRASASEFMHDVERMHWAPRRLLQLMHLDVPPEEVNFSFLFADPEGREWLEEGYGFYWDANWRRRVLSRKEKQVMYPPIIMHIEGIQ